MKNKNLCEKNKPEVKIAVLDGILSDPVNDSAAIDEMRPRSRAFH